MSQSYTSSVRAIPSCWLHKVSSLLNTQIPQNQNHGLLLALDQQGQFDNILIYYSFLSTTDQIEGTFKLLLIFLFFIATPSPEKIGQRDLKNTIMSSLPEESGRLRCLCIMNSESSQCIICSLVDVSSRKVCKEKGLKYNVSFSNVGLLNPVC